ncbi:MAG: hypothetical protein ACYTFT_08285, partial [Planctomycetota bacterium]
MAASESRPPAFEAGVAPELQGICRRALARAPADRYASVGELIEALEAFITHRESVAIAADATKTLERCESAGGPGDEQGGELNLRYAAFAEAIAGFHQALVLWDANEEAREGEQRARLAYADAALRHGDLGLAEAQVAPLSLTDGKAIGLRGRIEAARSEQERAARVARRTRRGLVGAVAVIVLGLLTGLFLADRARKAERGLREDAETQREIARKAEQQESQQRILAEKSAAQARHQLALLHGERGRQALLAGYPERALVSLDAAYQNGLDDPPQRLLRRRASLPLEGRVAAIQPGHQLGEVVFSEDGARLALTYSDGIGQNKLAYWDSAKGTLLAEAGNDATGLGRQSDRRVADAAHSRYVTLVDREGLVDAVVVDAVTGAQRRLATPPDELPVWVGITPEGARVVTLSRLAEGPDSLRVFNAEDGAELWGDRLPTPRLTIGPAGRVLAIELSNQGAPLVALLGLADAKPAGLLRGSTLLAIGPEDRRLAVRTGPAVEIYDSTTGKTVSTLVEEAAKETEVAFVPGGDSVLVVQGGEDSSITLFDTTTGEAQRRLAEGSTFRGVRFSEDGRWLLLGVANPDGGSETQLCEVETGRIVRAFEAGLRNVEFTPDSQRVLGPPASPDAVGTMYAVSNGAALLHLRPPGSARAQLPEVRTISSDGSTCACSTRGAFTWVFDAATGEVLARVPQQSGAFAGWVTLSGDGKRLAAVEPSGTVRIWDWETRGARRGEVILAGQSTSVRAARFVAGGDRIVTVAGDLRVGVYDAETGDLELELDGGEADDAQLDVQLSHDGNLMAVGRSWGKVRIYDLAAGKLQRDLEIGGGLGRILLKPDGSSLLSYGPIGPPEVWDLTEGGPGVPLADDLPPISFARFAPGGETLALGLPDGSVVVVDPGRPEPVRLAGGHATAVVQIVFDAGGARILTVGDDQRVCVWSAADGRTIASWKAHAAAITAAQFSPDGQLVLTASEDNTVRLWATADGALLRTLEVADLEGWQRGVADATFDPSGRLIASAHKDNVTRVWDSLSGALLLELAGPGESANPVHEVRFHPGGAALLSAAGEISSTPYAILWDLA